MPDIEVGFTFEGDVGIGTETLYVDPRCPACKRIVKRGTVSVNGLGQPRFEGWACPKHGPFTPQDYEWA